MPGANCSIYGCGTSRKHVSVSIFRISTKDDELSQKTRDTWVKVVCRDRKINASLRNQIAQQTINICEKHFESYLIETCKCYSKVLADDLRFSFTRLVRHLSSLSVVNGGLPERFNVLSFPLNRNF